MKNAEKEYIGINREIYDSLALEYAYRRDHVGEFSESAEYLGNSLLKHVQDPSKATVLEVGSGPGQILSFFENSGCRTVGVELSSEMCKLASQESPKSLIVNENIEDIEFYDEQFDLIYMGAIIHLFPVQDEETIMKKVWRWLKPDGHIFVNTTCHDVSREGYYYKEDYNIQKKRFRRYWREDDFEEFIRKTGFDIIERLYTDEKDKNKKWVAFIARKEM